MKESFWNTIKSILTNTKNYKVLAWIFIMLLLIIVLLYPILDANFLYSNRESKRIELLQQIISLKVEANTDERILNEYNSILDDLGHNRNNSLDNVINFHDKNNNATKFIAGAWFFILAGLYCLFTKGNDKRVHLLKNLKTAFVCCIIGVILGYIAIIIPTIVNIFVNIILYQIILIFLAYTIYTSTTHRSK